MIATPVIIGPTAGGKSALAVELAHLLEREAGVKAEIVTADSIQVYRGLDIGSAKPTAAEQATIPHHMIDIVEPTATFSVESWLNRAEATIDDIRKRGAVPIVVGGTHLYIKAFLDGLFRGPDASPELRESLGAMDPVQRRKRLEEVDPDAAARIHANDVRRTVRALEVFELTGETISSLQTQWDQARSRTDCVLIGLEWPTDVLNQRINARVRQMMELGLLEETRALALADQFGPTAREALGYKQLLDFLRNEESSSDAAGALDEAVERIKVETRRFAKNQRTWLRRLRTTSGSLWLEAADQEAIALAQWVISRLLDKEQPT